MCVCVCMCVHLRMQGRTNRLKKAWHHVLNSNFESTHNFVANSTCRSSVGAFCVELWTKQTLYGISIQMPYNYSIWTFGGSNADEVDLEVYSRSSLARSSDLLLIYRTFTSGRPQVSLKSTWKSTSSAQVSMLTHNKRDVAIWLPLPPLPRDVAFYFSSS